MGEAYSPRDAILGRVTGSPPLRSAVQPPPEAPSPEVPSPPPARPPRRRRFAAWRRGPGGRFVIPALGVIALLAATGSAGIYLPEAVAPAASPSPSASP